MFLSVDSHSCSGSCDSLRNGAQPGFDCVSFNVSQDPRAVSITGAAITCVKRRQKQKEGLGDLGDKAWAHILVIAVVCSLSFSYWAHFACAASVLWLPKIKSTHVLHIHRCWEGQKERFALVTQSVLLHQFPNYLQCNQSSFTSCSCMQTHTDIILTERLCFDFTKAAEFSGCHAAVTGRSTAKDIILAESLRGKKAGDETVCLWLKSVTVTNKKRLEGSEFMWLIFVLYVAAFFFFFLFLLFVLETKKSIFGEPLMVF